MTLEASRLRLSTADLSRIEVFMGRFLGQKFTPKLRETKSRSVAVLKRPPKKSV
ncbi:hypothetical protein D3C78_1824960 [compost metagenome]